MRPLRILTLAFLLFTLTAAAQTDRRIEEQKRDIAALDRHRRAGDFEDPEGPHGHRGTGAPPGAPD